MLLYNHIFKSYIKGECYVELFEKDYAFRGGVLILLLCLTLGLTLVACGDEEVEPTLYTVTFDSNGGTYIEPEMGLKSGDVLLEPSDPYKEGFTFEGWFKDEELSLEWDFNTGIVNESIELFAKWEPIYKIIYELNGGHNAENPTEFQAGETKELKAPIKEGYVFDGWYLSEDFDGEEVTEISAVASDVKVYAKWIQGLKIEYELNGGYNAENPIGCLEGERVEFEAPIKDGYVFDGWYLDDEFDGEVITEISSVESDTKVYAKWSRVDIYYTIVFSAENAIMQGEAIISVLENTNIENPPVASQEHFEFKEWVTKNNEVWDFDNIVTENLTLFATWTEAKYDVKFYLDGILLEDETIEVVSGKLITDLPTIATSLYYDFYGWYTDERLSYKWDQLNNRVTEDISLYSKVELKPIPVIEIYTEKWQDIISKETYLDARITVKNCKDDFAMYNQETTIRGRGNTTWSQEKKPYRIKFDKRTSMFGLPAAKNWVLLADYLDTTNSRNYMAYTLARMIAQNDVFQPDSIYVEFFLNGDYKGLYLFTEHMQVDKARVDIEEPEDNELDTGYFIELDEYAPNEGVIDVDYFQIGNRKYAIKSPENCTSEQVQFIKNYILEFEASLLKDDDSYLDYIDVPSFINFFIVQEILYNPEIAWKSVYFYKDKGGKLTMGPVWDFDWSSSNLNTTGVLNFKSVVYTRNDWMRQLMQKRSFIDAFVQRWNEVYNNEFIQLLDMFDDHYLYLKDAHERTMARWKRTQKYLEYDMDNGTYITVASGDFLGNLESLKCFLILHANYINEHLKTL